jgi:rSAM/selenodomain-associated transferase 2
VREPDLSIVIPVYREAAVIERCLQKLARQEGIGGAEVLVVDGEGGSTFPAIRGRLYPFRLITLVSEPGRGAQLDCGARRARAENLLFLHADTILPRKALRLVKLTLRDYAAGAFTLGVASGRLRYRMWVLLVNAVTRLTRIPYGDRAHFIRKAFFLAVGGYEGLPLMEDVALMDKLRRRRIPVRILKQKVRTSVRRWEAEGLLRSILRNRGLLLRYRCGVSAHTLADRYPPFTGRPRRRGREAGNLT